MNPFCKICDAPTQYFGTQRILMRHDAEYRRCTSCGYVFIVDPHWLADAYSTAIAALDTGIVTRNLWLADATCALLGFSLRHVRRSLDYGGGSGLFVRLMRDRDHDFAWQDAYSPNLLARGFEANDNDSVDLATLFELVEHLTDPLETLRHLRDRTSTFLISTELLSDHATAVDDWWYYAPESGQHIGFFTRKSLEEVAAKLGLQLSSNDRNLHVLAPHRISESLLNVLRKPAAAKLLSSFGKKRSLAHQDAAVLQRRLQDEH